MQSLLRLLTCCSHYYRAQRRKNRCSSATSIAFTLVCGPDIQCWPWPSTLIMFLTSTMFIVLHIVHRNYKRTKLNKDFFSSYISFTFFVTLKNMQITVNRKMSCLDVKVQKYQKDTVSLQLLIWILSTPLYAYCFEHVCILCRIFGILAPAVLQENDAYNVYWVKQDSTRKVLHSLLYHRSKTQILGFWLPCSYLPKTHMALRNAAPVLRAGW